MLRVDNLLKLSDKQRHLPDLPAAWRDCQGILSADRDGHYKKIEKSKNFFHGPIT